MQRIDNAPFTVYHDPLDWQGISGKYQGIEARVVAMARKHWIIVRENDQVCGGTFIYSRTLLATRGSAAPSCTRSQEPRRTHRASATLITERPAAALGERRT